MGRKRKRQTEGDRQTDRQAGREAKTQRDRNRHRETERDTQRDGETETKRQTGERNKGLGDGKESDRGADKKTREFLLFNDEDEKAEETYVYMRV